LGQQTANQKQEITTQTAIFPAPEFRGTLRREMMEQHHRTAFWVIVFGLLLLTRIPAMADYLSIDNVNLALSLEKFDPRMHQPQPPGYPFFVVFGRIVNFLFRDAERTFTAISLIVSALCLPAAFALGTRLFSTWAGAAAALLLLVNPVFWHSGLDGPLRPHLALFSLLTAYFCWRCWNGEKQFAMWAAIALGVGSGFRPDLLAFLLPLWLSASWVGTRSWRTVLQAFAVLLSIVAVWVGMLVWVMGGTQNFFNIMLQYGVDQSRSESIVLGSSVLGWLRQINRLVIWNALAVIPWVWAVPFSFKNRDRLSIRSRQFVFMFMWLVPGLVIQVLTHVAAPGHTLVSVAALCVLGGYALSIAVSRETLVAAALVVSVMLFLDFLQLPVGINNSPRTTPSIKNAFLFATFESSIGQVRYLDDTTRTSLDEIGQFAPKDRPSIIISTDSHNVQWFMNWRIARYYLPAEDFWILSNDEEGRRAEHLRRDTSFERLEVSPISIRIFGEGRILWLIEPDSRFHNELAKVQDLKGGKYVFYSDVTSASVPFTVDGFEIVPGAGHNGFQ
jgi:hypothetical protein